MRTHALAALFGACHAITTLYRYTASEGIVVVNQRPCECTFAPGLIVGNAPGAVSVAGAAGAIPAGSGAGTGPANAVNGPSTISSTQVVNPANNREVVITEAIVLGVPQAPIAISVFVSLGVTQTVYSTPIATVTSTVTRTATVTGNGGGAAGPIGTSSTSVPIFGNSTSASTGTGGASIRPTGTATQSSTSNPGSSATTPTTSGSATGSTTSSAGSASTTASGFSVDAAFCSALFGTATVTDTALIIASSSQLVTVDETSTTATTVTQTTITTTTTNLGDTSTASITGSNTVILTNSASFLTSSTTRSTTEQQLITQSVATKVYTQTATLCALENDLCSFAGTKTVYFGVASGGFTKLASATIDAGTIPFVCNSQRFTGDPAPGVGKTCFVAPSAQFAFSSPLVVPPVTAGPPITIIRRQAIPSNSAELAAASAACSQIVTRPTVTSSTTSSATVTTTVFTSLVVSTEVETNTVTSTEVDVETTGEISTKTQTPTATTQLPDILVLSTILNDVIQPVLTTLGVQSTTILALTSQAATACTSGFAIVAHDPAGATPAGHVNRVARASGTAFPNGFVASNVIQVWKLGAGNQLTVFYDTSLGGDTNPLAYANSNSCTPYTFNTINSTPAGACTFGTDGALTCGSTIDGNPLYTILRGDVNGERQIYRDCEPGTINGFAVNLQAVCRVVGEVG